MTPTLISGTQGFFTASDALISGGVTVLTRPVLQPAKRNQTQ